tara:strand:- start:5852 stop:6082 length:231 start_codon:yes stop_codon:yes gene_type:complete
MLDIYKCNYRRNQMAKPGQKNVNMGTHPNNDMTIDVGKRIKINPQLLTKLDKEYARLNPKCKEAYLILKGKQYKSA